MIDWTYMKGHVMARLYAEIIRRNTVDEQILTGIFDDIFADIEKVLGSESTDCIDCTDCTNLTSNSKPHYFHLGICAACHKKKSEGKNDESIV